VSRASVVDCAVLSFSNYHHSAHAFLASDLVYIYLDIEFISLDLGYASAKLHYCAYLRFRRSRRTDSMQYTLPPAGRDKVLQTPYMSLWASLRMTSNSFPPHRTSNAQEIFMTSSLQSSMLVSVPHTASNGFQDKESLPSYVLIPIYWPSHLLFTGTLSRLLRHTTSPQSRPSPSRRTRRPTLSYPRPHS
jgi:hypothetical protein